MLDPIPEQVMGAIESLCLQHQSEGAGFFQLEDLETLDFCEVTPNLLEPVRLDSDKNSYRDHSADIRTLADSNHRIFHTFF
ncbi:MAG: hypothetical protein R3E96_11535 [Planctomycetota bacterium]